MKDTSRLCLLIQVDKLKRENEDFRKFLEITLKDDNVPQNIKEQAEILMGVDKDD